MKCTLVFALALFAVAYSEEHYSTGNTNLNIGAVLSSKEQTDTFLNCFIDKAECKGPLAEIKRNLPEAIQQACAKCSNPQKVMLNQFIDGIAVQDPAGFKSFKDKYDPEDKYFPALKAAIA